MTFTLIVQAEGPFGEYSDGQYETAAHALDAARDGAACGAYLPGDSIEIVNDQSGEVAHAFTV